MNAGRRQTDAVSQPLSGYVPVKQSAIQNSNILGASMQASLWRYSRNDELRSVARGAVEYICSRQRPDGSWWYGEDPKCHWIDNFHTAYVLDSLKRYLYGMGDEAFRTHFQRGLRYFLHTFIRPDGHFYFRWYPLLAARTAYIHWG